MSQDKILIKANCGHYHSEDECETIVIKLIKGKNCSIDEVSKKFEEVKERKLEDAKNISKNDGDVSGGFKTKIIYENVPEGLIKKEVKIPIKDKRNIIPPGIENLMIPIGHPDFESKGAKEIRKIG
jgi:hypothetical protein